MQAGFCKSTFCTRDGDVRRSFGESGPDVTRGDVVDLGYLLGGEGALGIGFEVGRGDACE